MMRLLLFVILMAGAAPAVELETLGHSVLGDKRTFVRDDTDRRYSIWTDDPEKVAGLLAEFGFSLPDFDLAPGQIVAVFLNDNITEDLTQIVHNKSTNQVFADYADSGLRIKMVPSPEGQKYTHITVVVFKPTNVPSHLGMRGMVADGLSEKL